MLIGGELVIDTIEVEFVLLYVGCKINLISDVKTVYTFAHGQVQIDYFKPLWYHFILLIVIFCLMVFYALRHVFLVFFKNAFFEIYNSKLYNNICHSKILSIHHIWFDYYSNNLFNLIISAGVNITGIWKLQYVPYLWYDEDFDYSYSGIILFKLANFDSKLP